MYAFKSVSLDLASNCWRTGGWLTAKLLRLLTGEKSGNFLFRIISPVPAFYVKFPIIVVVNGQPSPELYLVWQCNAYSQRQLHIATTASPVNQSINQSYSAISQVSKKQKCGRLPEQATAIAQQSWPPSPKDRKTDRRRQI